MNRTAARAVEVSDEEEANGYRDAGLARHPELRSKERPRRRRPSNSNHRKDGRLTGIAADSLNAIS